MLLLCNNISHATAIFYTNQTSWDSQLTSQVTTNFNGFGWNYNGTYLGGSFTSAGINYQIAYDGGPYGIANASLMSGWGSQPNYYNGVPVTQYTSGGFLEWQDYYGEIIPLTITLSSPTKAIALNLGELYSQSATFVLILDNGGGSCTSLFSKLACGDRTIVTGSSSGYTFLGAVSDVPFTTVTIAASWSDTAFNPTTPAHYVAPSLFPIIDNVAVATLPIPTTAPDTIPEPSTLALLGLGLVTLIIFWRRNSQKV